MQGTLHLVRRRVLSSHVAFPTLRAPLTAERRTASNRRWRQDLSLASRISSSTTSAARATTAASRRPRRAGITTLTTTTTTTASSTTARTRRARAAASRFYSATVQHVPPSVWGAAAGVSALASANPWRFSAAFACIKAAGADIFAQSYIEDTALRDLDLPRVATFAIFGLVYIGSLQYFLLVHVLAKRLFPQAGAFAAKSLREKLRDGRGARQLFGQIAFDMMIHMPLIYFPFYYSIKETVFRMDKIQMANTTTNTLGVLVESVESGLQKWRENFSEDMAVCVSVWVPFDLLIFGFVPLHLRIPAAASVGFLYNVLLSVMRGAHLPLRGEEADDEAEVLVLA